MVNWPNELSDKPLISGMSEMLESNTLRTEMDQGPDKIRQRSTASIRKINISFVFDRDKVSILDGFYLDDLKSGSLSFSYTHPRDNNFINCRFLSPPEYKAVNGNYYNVNLKLEILP